MYIYSSLIWSFTYFQCYIPDWRYMRDIRYSLKIVGKSKSNVQIDFISSDLLDTLA